MKNTKSTPHLRLVDNEAPSSCPIEEDTTWWYGAGGGDNEGGGGDNESLPGRQLRESRQSTAGRPEESGKQAEDCPLSTTQTTGSNDASLAVAGAALAGRQSGSTGLVGQPAPLSLWSLDKALATRPENFSLARSKEAIRKWLDLLFPYYQMKDGFRLPIARIRQEAILSKPSHWWLKNNLLIGDTSYSATSKISKRYVVRARFYDYLWQELYSYPLVYLEQRAEWWGRKWDQLVADPSVLRYYERGDGLPDRRYSFYQELPNSVKPVVMRGFVEHDLSTAGVTLISQQAIKDGLSPSKLTHVNEYIHDKAGRRRWLAKLAGCTEKEAKDIFTMVSYLSPVNRNHPSLGIRQVLSKKQVDAVMKHGWMSAFYNEMRLCWETCLGELWKDGYARHRFYTSLEREVLAPIEEAMQQGGIPYLLQHDGFVPLDGTHFTPAVLAAFVKERTGFTVKFDLKSY